MDNYLKSKVFHFTLDSSDSNLESIIQNDLNKWLKKKPNCEIVKIEKTLFDHDDDELLLIIFYRKKKPTNTVDKILG